jgi:hypothetical protein
MTHIPVKLADLASSRDPLLATGANQSLASKVRDCDGLSNFSNLSWIGRAIHQYGCTQDETSPTQTSRAIPTLSRRRKYSERWQQGWGPKWRTEIHEYSCGATFRRNAQRCALRTRPAKELKD